MSKLRTHKKFSFSVRIERSATPLPSGSRTKLGELSIPKKPIYLLEVIGQVVRAVVVTQAKPARNVLADAAATRMALAMALH